MERRPRRVFEAPVRPGPGRVPSPGVVPSASGA